MLDQSLLSRIVLVDIGLNGNDDSWLPHLWSSGIVRGVVVVIVVLVPLLAVQGGTVSRQCGDGTRRYDKNLLIRLTEILWQP
jgi:hypothetical protein